MSRISTASSSMRLAIMLAVFCVGVLALTAGFFSGALVISGPYHEGDVAVLLAERGINDIVSTQPLDAVAYEKAAQRLLAESPILSVHFLTGETVQYQQSVQPKTLDRPLPALDILLMQDGRIFRDQTNLYYVYSPVRSPGLLVVLEISRASRPCRVVCSAAFDRLASLPAWLIAVLIGGYAFVSLVIAWLVVWIFFSRHLSRLITILEACEAVGDLSAGKRLFAGVLTQPLTGCAERLISLSDADEKNRNDALLPRRRGYDFPGFDAATVYVGSAPTPLVHADIRPLGEGRYGIVLLALDAEEESEDAMVRLVTACDTSFSLFDNPAQIASALNRYMHSMAIPFPVDAGFMLWNPAQHSLEFCLNGRATLLRYDLREGILRGYDLHQPAIGTLPPEEFDAQIGFASLELGVGDPLVLAFAPGIEWEALITEVLKKSTTIAERQQTLAGLLTQRLGANTNAAALVMSAS